MVCVFLQSIYFCINNKNKDIYKIVDTIGIWACRFPNIMGIVRDIHMLSQCQTIKLSVATEMLSFLLVTAGGWMWYSVILLNSHDEFIVSVGKTWQHLLEHQSVYFFVLFLRIYVVRLFFFKDHKNVRGSQNIKTFKWKPCWAWRWTSSLTVWRLESVTKSVSVTKNTCS